MLHSFALLTWLTGCFGGSEETPEPAGDAPAPAPEAEPEPAAEPSAAYLVGRTTLRKVSKDDKKVDDPNNPGKQMSNYVTALSRGERVDVLGTEADWTHVKLSDGQDGWLHGNRLVVVGPDTQVATLYEDGKVFTRPDLLALEADKKIEPGSLLFVLQTKDQFAEVDYPKSGTSSGKAWTLANALVTDANEVEAAKLIMKVRQMRADNDPGAPQMEELARSQFGTSKLIALLDVAPPEAPPEGEGAPTDEVPPPAPPQ